VSYWSKPWIKEEEEEEEEEEEAESFSLPSQFCKTATFRKFALFFHPINTIKTTPALFGPLGVRVVLPGMSYPVHPVNELRANVLILRKKLGRQINSINSTNHFFFYSGEQMCFLGGRNLIFGVFATPGVGLLKPLCIPIHVRARKTSRTKKENLMIFDILKFYYNLLNHLNLLFSLKKINNWLYVGTSFRLRAHLERNTRLASFEIVKPI
jgi:hypothetical protein